MLRGEVRVTEKVAALVVSKEAESKDAAKGSQASSATVLNDTALRL